MRQLLERCCGLDVHKKSISACARVPDERGEVAELYATFGTTTPDLLELSDWMMGLGVTHVAMEATGDFWKPVYYILEADFELLLVNPAHIKHVPGRKTDAIDAAWIAELLSYGLLRKSFVPPPPIRRLRDLTRYRKALIRDRSREVNRVHKVLEDAGVKLSAVATDVMGVSGRAIMEALIGGTSNPDALASLAKGRLRAKIPELHKALTARFKDHHGFMLQRMLAHIDDLDADIAAISGRIEAEIGPFAEKAKLLPSITGVGPRAAEAIIGAIGVDMSVFPTSGHLASWAGLCPGQRESAGKRKSSRTRKGSELLRTTLVECAHSASHTKDTYLAEFFWQVTRRQGKDKAIVAVAHEILIACWRVLSTGTAYCDPGPGALRARSEEQIRRRAIRQLESLGLRVTLDAA
ncbi:MAG: IS110 family transposase [Actinobacteria bacterium]|nr:MAG: IS110 family transposase [Actinomycetota bacterium]